MNDLILYFLAAIAILMSWLLWEIHQKLNQISNQNLQSFQAIHDALTAIYKKQS